MFDKFQFAEKVAADFAASNKRYAGFKADPTFLDFLMKLFETLQPMIGGCFLSPQEAAESAMENTLMGRFRRSRFNRVVRAELDDYDMEGEMLTPLGNSVLKVVAAS